MVINPSWIAEILEIMKDEQGNKGKSSLVHRYHTSSPNAFTRKYSLEMVKDIGGTNKMQRRIRTFIVHKEAKFDLWDQSIHVFLICVSFLRRGIHTLKHKDSSKHIYSYSR